MPAPLAIIILTKNEQPNLPACLASLAALDAEIFVIDCGSTDDTVAIARRHGATVLYHPWTSHATQMNWALDYIPATASWILRLDADERLTPGLRSFISEHLKSVPSGVAGIALRRRNYFLGRWIRHGGMYPIWLLRIWRRGMGRCEDRWMDEHIAIAGGRSIRVPADIIHDNQAPLADWIEKHNSYAARECRDLASPQPSASGLQGQARVKRWMKENIYGHAPLLARAWLYWFYRYFLRLGFLDGVEGFLFHFFQGLWYRSLVDAKMLEARRARASQPELGSSQTLAGPACGTRGKPRP
jgi:glycosyltransferase involved in cell wall biosynthesis